MRKGKSAAKVLSCLMAAGMVLQTVGGLGGSGTVHAEETQPGSELLYFVDAGTMNPEKLGAGDQLGKYNSVTEQFYGEDPVTGKMWGLMDTPVEEEDYPDLMTGEYTWPCENKGYTQNTDSATTFRYAKDQHDGTASYGIPYKFEVENGTYDVRVTMATGWSNQVGRDKYKVVLNEGKETEVSETDIPAVGDASNPSVSMQTVEVDDGELTLNIRYADNKTLCAVVNQIYIMYHGPRFSSWTYNMDLKESVQLTTENVENPENITGWLSDNPEVANVDEEGNVFATGVGNAKITAIYEGKSLQCTIAVTNENGVTVDYSVDAGEMNHVAGGNLHLYDDRSPAGWLSDGIGVYAVRGQNYSNRTSSEYEYLPGFFEEKTYNRLMEESPDAKLMIGLYYGYKGRTGGEWKKGAYDSGYMQMWAQNCVDIYNDAKEKEIDVYSWIPLNEPDLQWSGDDWDNDYPAKFFEVAYKAIKAIDPDARIQGPEMASSNMSRMRQFLTYCRDNDCLPDVLSWHDLRNGQSGIEGDVQTLTDWMENNGITPMPMAVTEYQGMGYSTDEAGRKAQGNYNTGLTISYLATLERSVDDGVIAGLRSEWGLPGSNSGARGDMGEMCDFDTKRMPTGLWYVYNAYWDMTGRKVQTEQNSSMLDALATIDLSLEKLQSGILIGNWKENDRLILLDLKNIPTELIVDKQIHIQVYALNETLATPCYGAVPVMDENVEVSGNSLALDLPISGRQACYVVLSQPYVTVNKTLVSDITPVLTGNMMAQIVGSGAQEYISITGGKTSSYVDAEGKETYRENGDSVTYTLSAEQDGVYNFTSKLVKGPDAGFMQLYIDGEQFGFPTDLYGESGESFLFNHGNLYLTAGEHKFRFQIVGHGKNSESTGMNLNFAELCLNRVGVLPGEEEQEPVLERIEVTGNPDKTVYSIGEEFSAEGIEVTGYYSDGTSRVLGAEEYQVDASGFDAELPGIQYMKVVSTENAEISISFVVLVKVPVNKTALDALVAMAQKYAQQQAETPIFEEESFAAMETALAAAETVLADDSADQDAVDKAFTDLVEAVNNMDFGVQKTGLKAAIEGAKAILEDEVNLNIYSEESIENLRKALENAETVFDNRDATQEEVAEATNSLIDASVSLIEKSYIRLAALIQTAEKVLENSDRYTEESVNALKEALENAQTVLDNPDASTADRDSAYNELAAALGNMMFCGDKTELENILKKAQEILQNAGRYVPGSREGLEEAAAEAEVVYADPNAVQSDIDAVVKALVKECMEVRLLGDVNEDGTVNTEDGRYLLEYCAELETLTEGQKEAADVNLDGVQDTKDASRILEYAAEKITSFGE